MAETLYCTQCGAPVGAEDEYCDSCGARQDVEPAAPDGTTEQLSADGPEGDLEPPTERQPRPEPPTEPQPETAETERLAAAEPAPPERAEPVAPAARREPAASELPQPPKQRRHRRRSAVAAIERLSPGAGEFAAALGRRLRTPVAAAACLAALAGFTVVLLVALLVAVLLPDRSLVSFGGISTAEETLNQMCGFTLASFQFSRSGESFRSTPALFALVPLLGCALGARAAASQTIGMTPLNRLLVGAATAIPFALLMLIPALAAGTSELGELRAGRYEPEVGSVFGMSLLWGALGGLAGAFAAARVEAGDALAHTRPGWVGTVARALALALRPLALVLTVCLVIGTLVVLVQTLRDVDGIRGAGDSRRSAALVTVDTLLYSADHGVHFAELGAGAKFRDPSVDTPEGVPLPVERLDRLLDDGAEGTFRIFAYRDPLPVWAFVLLLGLIVVPLLGALYAGFALARASGAVTAAAATVRGALVGPIWALAMVVVEALVGKSVLGIGIFGEAVGDSVLLTFLLGGALIGGLGGSLAIADEVEPRGPVAP